MKSGKYLVSFEVELDGVQSEDEAKNAVATMIQESLDENEFPELDFEFLEELDETEATVLNELEDIDELRF